MAAGLGFKTFTTGDVLTAGDTNGYLMQGVLVFASAAARTSAITSPQEGQYSYLKDTNSTEYYNGSAWVAQTSSAPSWTQISDTRVLSTSSFTVSSLGTYNRLYIAFSEVTPSSGSRSFELTLNGSSSAVYKVYRLQLRPVTTWDVSVINSQGNYNAADTKIQLATATSSVGVNGVVNIDNMLSANHKILNYAIGSSPVDGAYANVGGSTFSGSAITEFTVNFAGSNISDGRVIVYGSTM